MLRIFYFCLILHLQYLMYEESPLIGEKVRKADSNEFPFIVSISLNNSMKTIKEGHAHLCTGSLITTNHVLTAAHCFIGKKNYNEIVVKVGSFDLKNAQIHRVKWCVTYGEWVENEIPDEYRFEITHDIAIIKLVQKVSSDILPVGLLPILTSIDDNKLQGRNTLTAGWGLIEDDARPRIMRIAELTVLSSEKCLFIGTEEDLNIKNFFTKIYLCTKAKPSIILGCGDSGGPLLINTREIIGVNIGTCRRLNNCNLSGIQNKHLSINFHRKFINEVKRL